MVCICHWVVFSTNDINVNNIITFIWQFSGGKPRLTLNYESFIQYRKKWEFRLNKKTVALFVARSSHFSSPEPKPQDSFSNQNLFVVSRCCCRRRKLPHQKYWANFN